MTVRTATCICGQLSATCTGEPLRNSICHCLDCKRRSGSAFSHNATFAAGQVRVDGDYWTWTCVNDEGRTSRFHHCPACGNTVFYEIELRPGMISVPAGGFADPDFPAPTVEVYENRTAAWCRIEL